MEITICPKTQLLLNTKVSAWFCNTSICSLNNSIKFVSKQLSNILTMILDIRYFELLVCNLFNCFITFVKTLS